MKTKEEFYLKLFSGISGFIAVLFTVISAVCVINEKIILAIIAMFFAYQLFIFSVKSISVLEAYRVGFDLMKVIDKLIK